MLYLTQRALVRQAFCATPVFQIFRRNKTVITEIEVWPSAMVIDGDILWIFHGKLNLLLSYDLIRNITKIKGTLPQEEVYKELLIASMCKIGQSLYLIPAWGQSLYRYDINTETFEKIAYPEEEDYRGSILFCGMHILQGLIYCIPSAYPYILQINPLTNTVRKIINVKNIMKQYGFSGRELINDFVYFNDKFICVIEATNKLLVLDLKKGVEKLIAVGNSNDCYYGINVINKKIYLCTWDQHEIIILKENLEIMDRISNIPYNQFWLLTCGNILIVDSACDGQFLIINEFGELLSTENKKKRSCIDFLYYSYYYGVVCSSPNYILYFDRYVNELCFIKENKIVKKAHLSVDKNKVKEIVQLRTDKIIYENANYNIFWMMQDIYTSLQILF